MAEQRTTGARTSEQRRADEAFRLVGAVAQADRSNYGQYAHKLPILIRTCGLVSALVFVQVKGKNGGKLLLEHLAQQLRNAGIVPKGDAASLVEAARTAPLPDYMRMTRELLWVLNWHKRLSVSILGVHQGEES